MSVPSAGFAGAKAVRVNGWVNILSSDGKTILHVRPSPVGNAKAADAIKVDVNEECVTVDPAGAFASGAQQVILEMSPVWPRDNLSGWDCLFVSDMSGDGALIRFVADGSRVNKREQIGRAHV